MRLFLILAGLMVPAGTGSAQTVCALALILGLDVSGSVDAREYRLQLDGLATALSDPAVQGALLARIDGPVALFVFEWSTSEFQRVIVDWTVIGSRSELARVTELLTNYKRKPAPFATSIGGALLYAANQFERGPACARRTIDLSGDGKSNDWPPPSRVLEAGQLQGITVNALVIGSDTPLGGSNRRSEIEELMAYFESEVISGPRAFAVPVVGYQDYAPVMTRKLLRELAGPELGLLQPASEIQLWGG
ncbi:MAG: DUF1194 domain-containing protein [Halocynthiibacter sp.]